MGYAQAIKSAISMIEVGERYGFQINHNKIRCPFHNEKTASMKLYRGTGGYYCFGCGAHGDVINFVEGLFKLNFQDACKKLNNDFCLGLRLSEVNNGQRKSKGDEKGAIGNQAIDEKKQRRKELEFQRGCALDRWIRYDRIVREQAPLDDLANASSKWIDALKQITIVEDYLNNIEALCAEEKLGL